MQEKLSDHKMRVHAILSASAANRWLACSKSALAESIYPNQDTEYTREGTLAHEIAEAYARQRINQNGVPTNVLDSEIEKEKSSDPSYSPEMLRHAENYASYIEEHLSSDSDSVLLEQRIDFSEWVPEGFGTADCILLSNDTITVIDYKYGKGVSVSAENNPQMKLYALGALYQYGLALNISRFVLCIYQPRLDNVSEWSITTEELVLWADNVLRPKAKTAYEGRGRYNAGKHCKFCRHAGRCRALAKTHQTRVKFNGYLRTVEHLTDEEINAILREKKQIEEWLKSVERNALNRILAGETIEGLKLVEGRSDRTWEKPDEVSAVLQTAGYTASAIFEPMTIKTVAQMENLVGKKQLNSLVGDFIVRQPGKPTVTVTEDKRPDFIPGNEFEIIGD